mgnify:CR=1 FL=1
MHMVATKWTLALEVAMTMAGSSGRSLRSLFLAALLVVSVCCATAPLAGTAAAANSPTGIELDDDSQLTVTENNTRTVSISFGLQSLNENEPGQPVEISVEPGADLDFTAVDRVTVDGTGAIESSVSVDNGDLDFALNGSTAGYDPGRVTVHNVTVQAGEDTYPFVNESLVVRVSDPSGDDFTVTNEDAFDFAQTTHLDATPEFVEQPSVTDGDGDGTLSTGENVTVTASIGQPTERVWTKMHLDNYTNASEAIDGDATPATTNVSADYNGIDLWIQFASAQSFDAIQYEFASQPPAKMRLFVGGQTKMISPENRTVWVNDSVTDANAVEFFEISNEPETPLSISDVNIYDDGRKLDESSWSATFIESTSVSVGPRLVDPTRHWTSPLDLDSNYHRAQYYLQDEHDIKGVRLSHAGNGYPRNVDIWNSPIDGPSTKVSRELARPNRTITFEPRPSAVVNVVEQEGSLDAPWKLEDVVILTTRTSNTDSVTIDASEFGVGAVEAQHVGNATYTATFTPDYENISDGAKRLDVTVTDGGGDTRTAQPSPIRVDTSAPKLVDAPAVNDGDDDGSLASGEQLQVSGEFAPEPVQPSEIHATGANVTANGGYVTSDDVWTSDTPVGQSRVLFSGSLTSSQYVDTVEVTFASEPPTSLRVQHGLTDTVVTPTNRTVRANVSGGKSSFFWIADEDDSSTHRLQISNIDLYRNGSKIDESWTRTAFMTRSEYAVTDTLSAPAGNWETRMPLALNYAAVDVVLDDSRPITGVRLDQVPGHYSPNVTVGLDDSTANGDSRSIAHLDRNVTASETVLAVPVTTADKIEIWTSRSSVERPWTIEQITPLVAPTANTTSVTVDASSLGAGTVDATIENGSFEATIQPDFSSVDDGTYTLPVTITDDTGETRTVETTAVVVDTSDETTGDSSDSETTTSDTGDDTNDNDQPSTNDDPGGSAAPSGGSSGSSGIVGTTVDIVVRDASLENQTVEPDETVRINVTVENAGNADGSETILVTAGEHRWTTDVTVPSRERRTFSLERSLSNVGSYAVQAEGVSAGTLTVATATAQTNATATTSSTPADVTQTPDSTVDSTDTETAVSTAAVETTDSATQTHTVTDRTTLDDTETTTATTTATATIAEGGAQAPATPETTSGSGPLGLLPVLAALSVVVLALRRQSV